ncbi:type I secretion C-terminal target domain-containing protein, partial [Pelomonas sp. KK5]|uniref:type I secretion C-terminal target domain-containing protein n=1 Tax=Pelomonas sp. KK5 TaxID=1855730 RepID=UPI0011801DB7
KWFTTTEKRWPFGASMSDPDPVNNRPTFAQGFAAPNGQRFSVVVNHFKSKSSCPSGSGADADSGDLQGCWNATRVAQAQRLLAWLPQVQAATGSTDAVMVGDFNSYAKEDPVATLTGALTDVVEVFHPGGSGYSYVFDGASGRLDHGFTTASLAAKVTGVAEWHVNADEPTVIDYNTEFKQPACTTCGPDYYTATAYRSSDHDPLVIGLNLVNSLGGGSGRDTIVGTPGDDVIEGGPGADTLTGNGGHDVFVYRSILDAGDTITDFNPADDKLDLHALLQEQGIAVADPLASGHVSCTAQAAGAVIGVDVDGSAGPAKSRAIVQLKGVACGALTAANYKF